MSLIKDALRQKKANRRKEEQLRKAAMQNARLNMTAEARLSALIDQVEKAFEDSNVLELTFELEDVSVGIVSTALNRGKFIEYDTVLTGNKFIVRPKSFSFV